MTVSINELSSKELLEQAKSIRTELTARTTRVIRIGDRHAALVAFSWEHLGLTATIYNDNGFEVKLLSDLDLTTLQKWTELLTYLSGWDGSVPMDLSSDYSDILDFVSACESEKIAAQEMDNS